MTIDEARTILGKNYDTIPDKEIENLIALLTYTSNYLIEKHLEEAKKINT